MAQHKWQTEESDGVGNPIQRCTNGVCTIRKVENCSTFWQRAKGGHWRDTENEEIPACAGAPVGRRKRTPAESSSS